MRGMVPNDPLTHVSDFQYAVIYAPRKKRTRFPASCVTVFDSLDEAAAAEEPDKKRYAAKVHGPSKSSEGQYIYYLQAWV